MLGDRYEAFAAAAAAHLINIPVAHLHGGESTYGAIDDKLRHSITQLSSLHFTAAEEYRKRVVSMTGAEERVWNVGPMVIDGMKHLPDIGRIDFEKSTGFKFGTKNLLVTYHPETLLQDRGVAGFKTLLEALEQIDCNVLFTQPNADEGSRELQEMLEIYVRKHQKKSLYIKSLGHARYLAALRLFEAMAGNSSSGIIEAPILSMPVLNIGGRQDGRVRSPLILDVSGESSAIRSGLSSVLAKGARNEWPRPVKLRRLRQ